MLLCKVPVHDHFIYVILLGRKGSNETCLITGDIQELFDTILKPGHAAAFAEDCDSASSKGIIRGAGNQVNNSELIILKKEKKMKA